MRIQDGELAGNQQNVSKFVFGDYCSFVTYLIGNLGLVQYSQLLVNIYMDMHVCNNDYVAICLRV